MVVKARPKNRRTKNQRKNTKKPRIKEGIQKIKISKGLRD